MGNKGIRKIILKLIMENDGKGISILWKDLNNFNI